MSNAFWALQGLLLLALVVTGIRVELARRREERAASRRVPVERRHAAAREVRLRWLEQREAAPRGLRRLALADVGLGQFTLRERARLLLLRGSVQDARAGGGSLHDDLEADASSRWVVSARASSPPTQRPVRQAHLEPGPLPRRRWTGRHWTLAVAALLVVIGGLGMLQTNTAMQASSEGASVAERFVPGLLANPGKYARAVNTSTPSGASLEAVVYLQEKQAMDRWEAVLVLGAALLLATRHSPHAAAQVPQGEAARQSSIANDCLPFLFLAAVLFAALSVFELP